MGPRKKLGFFLAFLILAGAAHGHTNMPHTPYAEWPWSIRILLEHRCDFEESYRVYRIQDWWEHYWFNTTKPSNMFLALLQKHEAGDSEATKKLESMCFFPDDLFLYQCSVHNTCDCLGHPITATIVNEFGTFRCSVDEGEPCIPVFGPKAEFTCVFDTYCDPIDKICKARMPNAWRGQLMLGSEFIFNDGPHGGELTSEEKIPRGSRHNATEAPGWENFTDNYVANVTLFHWAE